MSTRQIIALGTTANDGTGDTARSAGQKINSNFALLFNALGDSDLGITGNVRFDSDGVIFTNSSFESKLSTTTLTADRTITLPDADGQLITTDQPTLSGPTVSDLKIYDADSSHTYNILTGNLTSNQTLTIPALTDSDDFVLRKATQTLQNKTITAPLLNIPKINGSIRDENNQNVLGIVTTASAVNYLVIRNAATGQDPRIYSTGADSDIDLSITCKNQGKIRIGRAPAFLHTGYTSSGSINTAAASAVFNSATPITITLPNGSITTETRFFINNNSGEVTLTPTSFANGTSLVLRENAVVQLMWVFPSWRVMNVANFADSSDPDALFYLIP